MTGSASASRAKTPLPPVGQKMSRIGRKICFLDLVQLFLPKLTFVCRHLFAPVQLQKLSQIEKIYLLVLPLVGSCPVPKDNNPGYVAKTENAAQLPGQLTARTAWRVSTDHSPVKKPHQLQSCLSWSTTPGLCCLQSDKFAPLHLRKKARAEKQRAPPPPPTFEVMPPSGALQPGQRQNVQVKFMPTDQVSSASRTEDLPLFS